MKARKILAMVMALALTAALAVGGTLAYLTSSKTVTNTFTVGKVDIKLDEAVVNPEGEKQGDDRTEVGNNNYKLMPGHTYNKDPMVTVLKDSEKSYVKMTVTISKSAELDKILPVDSATGHANLTSIFDGYNSANWTYKGNTENTTDNTRTYEFWYKETVAAPTADVELPALFTSITVPGTITNVQLATIEGMTITVNAYAIQADGFANAEAAWAAYPAA